MLTPEEVLERAFPLRHPEERRHLRNVERYFGQYLRFHLLDDPTPPTRWFWAVAQERS